MNNIKSVLGRVRNCVGKQALYTVKIYGGVILRVPA